MKNFFVFCALAVTLIACTKNKFKTQPQIEIKSLSPSQVYKGTIFNFKAIVRDKEGDLKDSVLLVRKRFNGSNLLTVDTIRYSLKKFAFPAKPEIEINAQFSYGELRDGTIFENLENTDTNLAIGIVITDQAGHRSDYAESGKIVLKKL